MTMHKENCPYKYPETEELKRIRDIKHIYNQNSHAFKKLR